MKASLKRFAGLLVAGTMLVGCASADHHHHKKDKAEACTACKAADKGEACEACGERACCGGPTTAPAAKS